MNLNENMLAESAWGKTKETLCSNLSSNKAKNLAVILENTRNVLLNENATFGSTSASNIATVNKVVLPLLRRTMPNIIANEIVGVQPMTGPVGQINTLRMVYADTVPSNGTGITAGTEAMSPFQMAKFYSGNENVANPGGAPTSYLEGRPGNRMSVQILRETVIAKSRKLSARYNLEAAQDAQSQHGIDLESELMSMMAQEIVSEIDQEILNTLRMLPGAPAATYDQSKVSGTATFVGDEHASLALLINRQANLIAARTRRGPANWVVVSPTALTILQSASTSAFARTTEGTFEAPSNTKFVGTLNSSVRVYSDNYANDDTPVLVGYKGSDNDAGLYYCPYIPVISSGTVMDPNTFEPVIGFMTRYGVVTLTNTASSLGNSGDYYATIGINTKTLSFL